MSERITFKKMLEMVEKESGLNSKNSDKLLRQWFSIINEGLERDGRVRIRQFGTFKLQSVKERKGINPRTRESIVIPAHTKVVFNGAKRLKEHVNKKYNLLEAKPIAMKEENKSQKKELENQGSVKNESDNEVDDLISQIKETPDTDSNKLKYDETPPPVKEETKISEIKKKKSEELRAKVEEKFAKKENDFTPTGVMSSESVKPDDKFESPKQEKDEAKIEEKKPLDIVPPPAPEKVKVIVQKEQEEKEPESPIVEPKKAEEKKKNKLGIWIAAAVIIILILIVLLIWKPWEESVEVIAEKPAVKEVVKPEPPKPVVEKKVYKTPGGKNPIAKGDNLWDLSDEYYKDAYLWPNIYRVNDQSIENPDKLIIGDIITIPPLEGTFRSLTANDSVNIAVGFYKAYEAYKRNGNQWAKYYLWVCKKYNEKTFKEKQKNVEQQDFQFALSMK